MARGDVSDFHAGNPITGEAMIALAPDHADGLDLDLDAGPREVGDGDQRARREVAAGEQLATDLDETVAEARLLDEHGHGHEIRERAAGPAQGLVHEREHPARLRLEVA